jgi:mannosyl-oligosaccharide alpha-1,2-mannosidase
MYVYDSSRFSSYKDRWALAADSTIAHLASHPSSRPDLTFLAQFQNTTLDLESGHLACFDGGNFILGGLVLNEDKYVAFGLKLVEACEDTYNQTLTGIGPEGFSWNVSALPTNQTAFYEQAGFYITDSHYYLRPEVIESFYYAYRVTGSRVYQDVSLLISSLDDKADLLFKWAWNAFKAINATTRVGSGFSEITDVNAPNGGSFTNFQDSFLFAEVLKYRYGDLCCQKNNSCG